MTTDLPTLEFCLTPSERTNAALIKARLEHLRREANDRERDALERALQRALEAV